MNLSGYMGQRTGVPFPVISRISFGIHGAQIPALIRAVIAIAWFGIQTYLASVVLRVLLIAVHPGFAEYDHNSILGLSSLGWLCFVAIWFVQLAILAYGMEMVRRYEAFAGPVILLTVICLAGWMYFQANGTIAWSSREPLSTGEMWRNVFAGGALWLAITYGVMGVINMAHGELLMIGAYSAYAMQSFFRAVLPDYLDWYLAAARSRSRPFSSTTAL